MNRNHQIINVMSIMLTAGHTNTTKFMIMNKENWEKPTQT